MERAVKGGGRGVCAGKNGKIGGKQIVALEAGTTRREQHRRTILKEIPVAREACIRVIGMLSWIGVVKWIHGFLAEIGFRYSIEKLALRISAHVIVRTIRIWRSTSIRFGNSIKSKYRRSTWGSKAMRGHCIRGRRNVRE